MTARSLGRVGGILLLVLALAGLAALPTLGASMFRRTARVATPPGGNPNGTSANPSLSGDGLLVAFDSNASNLGPRDSNGHRDVYVYNVLSTRSGLVSIGLGGAPANGSSSQPAIAAVSHRVVFQSSASNLIADDTNGRQDVFYRDLLTGPIARASVATGGAQADGDSTDPDISEDGRFIAFASTASNLVADDHNGVRDIFVRDLDTGTTTRVSVSSAGVEGNGISSAPAISPDGHFVSFTSRSDNLVPGDGNGLSDVFVRDLQSGITERVSVSTSGSEQNASVASRFVQISDVSRDGRFVVFDSDATNLVRRDRNNDTDVFVRDRAQHKTERVSIDFRGREGDNDSFAPQISADGRLVIFESFAEFLAPGTVPGPNILIRDRDVRAITLVSVPATGGDRGPEPSRELLQTPAIADNGKDAAFVSGADNLVSGDSNGARDLFLRLIAAPDTSIRKRPPRISTKNSPKVRFAASDPHADLFLCQVNRVTPSGAPSSGIPTLRGLCPSQFQFHNVRDGRYLLRVRAGGRGMLFDHEGKVARFTIDTRGPAVKITSPSKGAGHSLTTISGTANDPGYGVEKVLVAVGVLTKGAKQCKYFDGYRFKPRPCGRRRYVRAKGTTDWTVELPRVKPPALYGITIIATDKKGQRGRIIRKIVFIR